MKDSHSMSNEVNVFMLLSLGKVSFGSCHKGSFQDHGFELQLSADHILLTLLKKLFHLFENRVLYLKHR